MDKAYFQDQKVGNPIAQKEVSGATELLQTMKLKKAQTGMPVYQCNSCCRQTSCTCNLNSNCFIHSNQCPSGCAYVAFQLVPPPPAASPMSSSLLAPGNYKFMVTEDLKVVDASVVKAMEFIQAHAGDMTKIKRLGAKPCCGCFPSSISQVCRLGLFSGAGIDESCLSWRPSTISDPLQATLL